MQDFSLKYPEIAVLCQSRAQSWDVVASLQCAIPAGHQLEKQLCLRLIPSSCDFVRMLQRSESLLSFNPNNPTGHYSLDLSNPIDYTISERLAILDNWESVLRSSENKADISQLGNYSHARNTQYSNCPLPRSFTESYPLTWQALLWCIIDAAIQSVHPVVGLKTAPFFLQNPIVPFCLPANLWSKDVPVCPSKKLQQLSELLLPVLANATSFHILKGGNSTSQTQHVF